MPSTARPSGTYSVVMIAAKAPGKPVHSITRQKISHTWLASHTGASASSTRCRGRLPLSAPPAGRRRLVDERPRPPPALGPPRREVPEAGAVVGAAEHRVGDDAREQHDGREGAHRTLSAVGRSRMREGPYGTSPSVSSAASRQRRRISRRA